MKLNPAGDDYKRVISEGKQIEVIPVIYSPNGELFMLPPAIWSVDNWLVGFEEWHRIGMPLTFWINERVWIPGTNSSASYSLGFSVRMLEASPDSAPVSGSTIDVEAVRELVEAFKKSQST